MQVKTTVVLPGWCWDNAKDKQELKMNISEYMKRYPGYRVLKIGKHYAICETPNAQDQFL